MIIDDHTRKSGGHLGNYGAGYGETNKERPVPLPFSPEKHRPWIELPHLPLTVCACSFRFPFASEKWDCFNAQILFAYKETTQKGSAHINGMDKTILKLGQVQADEQN